MTTATHWRAPRHKRRKKKRRIYSLKALREAAVRDQGNLCWWCKREMLPCIEKYENHGYAATADHLIPKHLGGETKPGNIVAACRDCNNRRHPELNRTKEPRSLTIGEDVPSSPFEVLKWRVTNT